MSTQVDQVKAPHQRKPMRSQIAPVLIVFFGRVGGVEISGIVVQRYESDSAYF
jgi:hypothetical protein